MHALMYYQEPSSQSLLLPPQEFDELSEEGCSELDKEDNDESDAVTFAGLDESLH